MTGRASPGTGRGEEDQPPAIARAVQQASLGNFELAISILRDYLDEGAPGASPAQRDRAVLYLGSFHRIRGEAPRAEQLLEKLVADQQVGGVVRAHGWIELASIQSHIFGNYTAAFRHLEQAESLIDFRIDPGTSWEQDILHGQYHMLLGCLCYRTKRLDEALAQFERARDYYIARGSKLLVNCYLNMANIYAMTGRKRRARECIALALATQRQFGPEHAYGLVHLFEVLASHNLFVHGSEQKAIDSLMQISEEVVKNFGDFSKVFDFFSSILVQLHGGKIDLDVIRKITHEYGDDPLIKTFLPSLLTGCPPPGATAGNDVEDEVGGGGGELDRLEEMGDEETEEEGAEGGDADEEIMEDEENEDGEEDEDDEAATRGRK